VPPRYASAQPDIVQALLTAAISVGKYSSKVADLRPQALADSNLRAMSQLLPSVEWLARKEEEVLALTGLTTLGLIFVGCRLAKRARHK
jgi:hypothetical protein